MWRTAKLGDVCLVRRGTTITKKQTVEGSVPVVGGGTKPTYYNNHANREANCITVSGSGASAGFVNKWEQEIFASDCSTVEPKDENQLPQFVYYYLLSQQQYIYDNFRSGAAQPHVYAKDIATLPFPIIPLAEQQRIVAKLDEAFAEIEKLNNASIATLESLKVSIQRHRDILFSTDNDTGVEWKKYVLSEVLSSQPKNGKSPPKELQSDEGTPLLTLSAVTGNEFTPNDSIFTQASVDAEASYWIENGDLLITRANTRKLVGHVAIVDGIKNPVMYPDLIMKMRVNEQLASVQFVHQYLMTTLTRQFIEENAKGANPSMVKINQETVKKIPLRLPPLGLQSELYKEFSRAESEIRSLRVIVLQKLNALRRLKSAILAQELQPPPEGSSEHKNSFREDWDLRQERAEAAMDTPYWDEVCERIARKAMARDERS